MQAKHTPGPWKLEFGGSPKDFIITEPTGRTLCEPNDPLYGHNDLSELDADLRVISLEEAIANGRLIAAAPDLLAALKAVQLQLLQSNNNSEHAEEANNLVDAAIARAEEV